MAKYYLTFLFALLLVGCDTRYRYPCQNPDNWDKDYCQKPVCEVSRDCPEYIFKGQENITKSQPLNNVPTCKEK